MQRHARGSPTDLDSNPDTQFHHFIVSVAIAVRRIKYYESRPISGKPDTTQESLEKCTLGMPLKLPKKSYGTSKCGTHAHL